MTDPLLFGIFFQVFLALGYSLLSFILWSVSTWGSYKRTLFSFSNWRLSSIHSLVKNCDVPLILHLEMCLGVVAFKQMHISVETLFNMFSLDLSFMCVQFTDGCGGLFVVCEVCVLYAWSLALLLLTYGDKGMEGVIINLSRISLQYWQQCIYL